MKYKVYNFNTNAFILEGSFSECYDYCTDNGYAILDKCGPSSTIWKVIKTWWTD